MSEQNEKSNRRKVVLAVVGLLALLVAIVLIARFIVWPGVAGDPSTGEPVSQSAGATPSPTPTAIPTELPGPSDQPSNDPSPSATPSDASSDPRTFDSDSLKAYAAELVENSRAHEDRPGSLEDRKNVPPPAKMTNDKPEVILSGEDWFGGEGVNVCTASTASFHPYCGGEYHVGGVKHNWWQSVELAQRFDQEMRWHEGVYEGVNGALDIYYMAESMGKETQPGDEVKAIAAGDQIVHKSAGYGSIDEGYGHVSIVNFVEGNIVYAVEQNGNDTGRAVYIVIDNTLVRLDVEDGVVKQSANTVKGVVHSSLNTANPAHEMRPGYDEEEFKQYLSEVNKNGL